ncbi:MAG TPA: OmpA family protein, partial [Candidatus Polarisedimenticolia bacterium]|nr:OmpA family protein [Candidatus Polarisedimenticolia bacterium]
KEAQQMKDTYDSLVGKLQGELSAGQVQIQRLKDGINVNVAQEILFASGSAVVDTKGREVLGRVSDQLKQVPYQVLVVGHTDNLMIGPGIAARYPTNWELGGARAASVVRLFQDSGIDGKRLLAISAGPHQPVASNDTPEGRARNRRIEIRLRPVVVEEEMQKPS